MNNTNDLSKFGFYEIKESAKLLTKYTESPSILESGVKLEFNPNSGKVFLVDEDYNVVMINYEKDNEPLEIWYYCGNCGHEGFKDDFIKNEENDSLNCPECEEQIY